MHVEYKSPTDRDKNETTKKYEKQNKQTNDKQKSTQQKLIENLKANKMNKSQKRCNFIYLFNFIA